MMKLMFREIDGGRASPSRGVYVDLKQSPKPPEEVLRILRELRSLPYNLLADLGINILEEKIEVIPVTHYILGGVRIDEWGETAVAGLFAAGEVSGNIHGPTAPAEMPWRKRRCSGTGRVAGCGVRQARRSPGG